jgi:hypothetical protein
MLRSRGGGKARCPPKAVVRRSNPFGREPLTATLWHAGPNRCRAIVRPRTLYQSLTAAQIWL